MWRAVFAVPGAGDGAGAAAGEGAVDRAPGTGPAAGGGDAPAGTDGVAVVGVGVPHALAVALSHGTSPVVVVGHREDAEAVRTACSLLAGHRPDVPVAHLLTDHAPVAVQGALAVARALAADAGHGLEVAREALEGSWSAVVMSSVTGLARPNPTMAQHLRSWLPGSRFVVRQGPRPRAVEVARLPRLLGDVPRGRHDLVVGHDGADGDVARAVAAAVAPRSVRPVWLPGGAEHLFGRAEQYQLCLTPSPDAWQAPPAGPACSGCGLARGRLVCGFCHTREAADDLPLDAGDLLPEPEPVTAAAGVPR